MSHFAVLVIGEGVEEKLHPYEELHLPLDEWKTGELGEPSWCNKGEIPDGVDIAYVEHVDWDRMDAREREDASRRWDEAKVKLSDTRFKDLYGDDCDKEAFLKEEGVFSTYAVITDDGEWHSPGKVGWFGASSDTPEEATKFAMSFRERFIDSLPDGTRITIVDCHI